MKKAFWGLAVFSISASVFSLVNLGEQPAARKLASVDSAQCNRLDKKSAKEMARFLNTLKSHEQGFIRICNSCKDKNYEVLNFSANFNVRKIKKSNEYEITLDGERFEIDKNLFIADNIYTTYTYNSLAGKLNCQEEQSVYFSDIKYHNNAYRELLGTSELEEKFQECVDDINEKSRKDVEKALDIKGISAKEILIKTNIKRLSFHNNSGFINMETTIEAEVENNQGLTAILIDEVDASASYFMKEGFTPSVPAVKPQYDSLGNIVTPGTPSIPGIPVKKYEVQISNEHPILRNKVSGQAVINVSKVLADKKAEENRSSFGWAENPKCNFNLEIKQ